MPKDNQIQGSINILVYNHTITFKVVKKPRHTFTGQK